jgi:hypothetical protein
MLPDAQHKSSTAITESFIRRRAVAFELQQCAAMTLSPSLASKE